MLKRIDLQRSVSDVANVFFELGVLDDVSELTDLSADLRDDLGCDSQEIVSACELVSALALTAEPLDDTMVESVQDLVAHLSAARDPWLPTNEPFVMQGSTIIEQDVDTVFGYIRDYRDWPDVLAHVTMIEPETDDGKLQSFRMHIAELGSGDEYYVQSWRYVNEQYRIVDFLQPRPPEGFVTHKGGWRFEPLADGKTRLISFHGFELEEDASAEDNVALIRKHINAALNTWARWGNA
ncbi:SRPBCC family protein [Pseudovibrio sp. WM33]|uniref:SRPBCC family protein n=1 Tax=Pseudovibrio sp. WM33 TaxID=1735585 RepID=UPI0007AE768B|nr:SRPBCC family protein [Pseudovibrio sp. WM33]KZL23798.1 Polyketide cyclase / dehydrase and lipid transport [Pseudovibrio sp. WM33]